MMIRNTSPLHSLTRFLTVLAQLIILAFSTFHPTQAADPVVRAVMFFSPTCPHCHVVLEEVIPPLQEKYGEQLVILFVNIANESGQLLYGSYIAAFEIPDTMRGVPALVVGDRVMVGSVQIPEEFPGLIEHYLAEGGVGWPAIPGLDSIIAELEGSANGDETISSEGDTSTSLDEPQGGDPTTPGFILKFNQDPIGNSVSIVVLIGMVFALLFAGITFLRPVDEETAPSQPRYAWVIPLLCIAGFFVAGYLSFIEITQQEAVCGPIGDCNSVQNSQYATLFGFLPVGIFGLIGYVAILVSWLVWRYGPVFVRKWAALGMWGMSIFGVCFMVYLTFLEPFVIGATCAWCLSSAVIITAIMLVATGPATHAMSGEPLPEE